MTVIVTGAAGFIGAAVSARLLARGETVVGVDEFNAYYDPALKSARAARLEADPSFRMVRMDVADAPAFAELVQSSGATGVIHLAAQAGVRYSIENPFAYERSNLAGHLSVLEACRAAASVRQLVYASSSSVYGDRRGSGAFREDDPVDAPVSLYAATKRSGELMSQTYAHLYGLAVSGLRFFTVYGPWGRPDMAYFGFTEKILAGQPIEVFGEGRMARDFTFIDDIVDGVIGVLDHPGDKGAHRIFNPLRLCAEGDAGGGDPPLCRLAPRLFRKLKRPRIFRRARGGVGLIHRFPHSPVRPDLAEQEGGDFAHLDLFGAFRDAIAAVVAIDVLERLVT